MKSVEQTAPRTSKASLATWPHLAVALVLASIMPGAWPMTAELRAIRDDILRTYPGVVHLNAARLVELPPEEVMLFDVRTPSEYAVSHLEGAIRVNPSIDEDTFLSRYGSAIAGKKVIFYCSVGWRSSVVADRLQASLFDEGAVAVANLSGGIFGWSNSSRPLVDEDGGTRFVHPYDADWARLIEDASVRRYSFHGQR